MPDFQDAVAAFQKRHGADWYLFLNSPLWRAARGVAAEFSPSRKLPNVASAAEILQFGVVYAANDQGYFDAIQTLETLAVIAGAPVDPTLNATYLPDEPVFSPRPAPAPEAPPAPDLATDKPVPRRHRKAPASPSPKPKTPKR